MCGSKKKTQAIEPNSTTPRSSRTDPAFRSKKTPEPSRTPKKTSISEPSTSYGVFTTGSTSGTSSSSRASLASLRSSLPENPHIYDFSEIRKATNNFLTKRFSSSSSTSSWRCQIRSKDVIVIQRRFRRSIETSELRELLSVICKGHHSTIIKLLGASVSGNNIYLVYEFVNGANLAVGLRNPKTPDYTILPNWTSRMQVATDLAQGLEYIHHYTGLNLSLVHNHIKSTSVIVTEDPLSAKICHFGTSELCGEITGHAKKQHQEEQKQNQGEITEEPDDHSSATPLVQLRRSDSRAMRLQGTRGYMSPEFQSDGIGTQKSDVYAFGVVILELLSGEEPLKYRFNEETGEFSRVSVIQTATLAVGSGNTWGLRRWVDRRLRDSYPVEVADKLTRLALECVDVEPERRPDMRHVAGVISKLFLESKTWAEKMGAMPDFTVSLGPR